MTLTLTPTDNAGGSGMSGGQATTQYKIGTGSWKTGTTVDVPAPADHSGDGAQVVSYHSCDAAGNWETVKTVTVKIDTTAPTTTASGADALWHNTAVTLTLSPADNTGGSGMSGDSAATQYKIGTGAGQTGTTVDVPAPADHSGDGAQVVSYKSCDAAGNWETAKTVTVKIDTTPPTTIASGLQRAAGVVWQKQAGLVTLLAADSLSDVGRDLLHGRRRPGADLQRSLQRDRSGRPHDHLLVARQRRQHQLPPDRVRRHRQQGPARR